MRLNLSLLGLATTFGLAEAHTLFTTLFINNVNQGDGTCVRQPKDGNTCTGPIASPFSNLAMACGRDGQNAVAFTCPAPAGAKLTFEFRMFPDFTQPGVIDPSHKGPIAVYLKRVSSFQDSVTGGGWFKIWHEGYDTSAKKFATEKLIANNGLLSVDLPPALPQGNYLVRTELITLQNVTETKNGPYVDPQFYVSCAQLYIESDDDTSTLNIPDESQATIPGHLSPNEKGLTFNMYDEPLNLPYSIPGPKPFFPGQAQTTPPDPKTKTAADTPGSVPPNCLLKNANWCAFEVPSYTTETGCWAAVDNCYAQTDACYKTAPPSGSRNCDVWTRQKCDVLRDACDAGMFNGPPGKGEKLKEVVVNDVGGRIPEAVNRRGKPGVDDGVGAGSGSGSGSGSDASPSVPAASALPSVYLSQERKKAVSCGQRRRRGR